MNLPYIINVALILLTCLAFYKLLLRRETFYRANRFLLIACLAIAFVLPLLNVPAEFSLRKTVVADKYESVVNRQTTGLKTETVKDNQQQTIATQQPAANNQPPATSNQQPTTGNQHPAPNFILQASNFIELAFFNLLVRRGGFRYKLSFPGGIIIMACMAQPGDCRWSVSHHRGNR